MRILSAAMQGLLNSDSLTGLSTFWKLNRRDGVVFGFTDYDQPVVVNGIVFQADSGLTRSALQTRVDLSVPNIEATAILTSDAITEADLRAGVYDGATIQIWLGVPTDTNFATYGTIPLPGAFLGEIQMKDGVWVAELLGLSYALSQGFVEICTPTCQADLFDARCKIGASGFTDNSSVLVVGSDRLTFKIDQTGLRFMGGAFNTGTPPYQFGLITWGTGANAGLQQEIKEAYTFTDGGFYITLFLQMPNPVAIGDTFTIQTGCDKTLGTCALGYGNRVNFRGFPGIPGLNFLFDYGVATT